VERREVTAESWHDFRVVVLSDEVVAVLMVEDS
jgi:hypothetical protein